MTTNTTERDYTTPNSAAMGTNFGTLGLWALGFAVLFGLLFLAFLYGYLYFPRDVVLGDTVNVRPLAEEIPIDAMPILPDELGVAYDQLNDGQRDQLDGFGFTDEWQDGFVRVPLDTAITLMVDEGMGISPAASAEAEAEAADDAAAEEEASAADEMDAASDEEDAAGSMDADEPAEEEETE